MNTVKTLTTVSAVALLALSTAAMADDPQQKGDTPPAETGNIGQDAEKAWKNTKEDAAEAYENVKSVFTDETNSAEPRLVTIDPGTTAASILGKPVYNGDGERVATIKDIILDANDNASMVVLADGEFPGIDMKLVAFNYGSLTQQKADGDVIMQLTEETINQAAAFSYNQEDASDTVHTIPSNGYSVAELLDAHLIDERNEEVAAIDDISLKNGQAEQLIVAFDQILGMGGQKAAIGYKEAKLTRNGGSLNFQLNANQAAHFENFKKTAAKTN